MSGKTPSTTGGWEFRNLGKAPGWDALFWNYSQPLPELGPTDVLVRFRATALNFRDIAIVKGIYIHVPDEGIVPGSDGAGEVIAVGPRASRFHPGDKVLTFTYQTGYFGGTRPTPAADQADLGVVLDGTLREYGVFGEEGLVRMPAHLSFEEGAALNIAYVTAWNALFGGAQPLRAGDAVLVQGTGGVSVAALQLAAAAGATALATTAGGPHKEAFLRKLGARHVLDYKQDAAWGTTAKKLSPGGRGADKVVEIGGGHGTTTQSLAALANGGEIAVVGFLATAEEAAEKGPSFFDTILKSATVRGVQGGSRDQFEELNRTLEATGVRPAVDPHPFDLAHLKDAYQHQWERKQLGKVVVTIP